MLKYIMILPLMLISLKSYGESNSLNLSMPSTSQSYASDSIRAGQLDCRMAIGSSTNVEFGVMGVINQDNQSARYVGNAPENDISSGNGFVRDIGVYAKITIPIGAPKERLNCNTLYQLELTKKRLEVQKLQAEVAKLRMMQFEN